MAMKGFNAKNPWAMLGILISAYVFIDIVKVLFPLLFNKLVELAGVGNFTFSSLFAESGVFKVILSALVLIAILVLFGITVQGKSDR